MAREVKTTRQDILAAAEELFYGEGLRSVSVDQIAAKAGITKKALEISPATSTNSSRR